MKLCSVVCRLLLLLILVSEMETCIAPFVSLQLKVKHKQLLPDGRIGNGEVSSLHFTLDAICCTKNPMEWDRLFQAVSVLINHESQKSKTKTVFDQGTVVGAHG